MLFLNHLMDENICNMALDHMVVLVVASLGLFYFKLVQMVHFQTMKFVLDKYRSEM